MKRIGLALLLFSMYSYAQLVDKINPKWKNSRWDAYWLMSPADYRNFGVYHYRKTFEISAVPNEFIILVSADNRYRLFVNGKLVSYGPARGDLNHWQYESVDIAKYLVSGKNVIASVVWNYGGQKPAAQITDITGFIVQGNTEKEEIVSTNSTWKSFNNTAYSLNPKFVMNGYAVVGESINGNYYPWGWETLNYDDSNWNTIKCYDYQHGFPKSYILPMNTWQLVPRKIPLMQDTIQPIAKIVRSTGINPTNDFITGKGKLTVPPNTTCSILFDQTYLTNAYVELLVSNGKNAIVQTTYAEALIDYKKATEKIKDIALGKFNRNQINGLEIHGMGDKFIADGGQNRLFSTLWFRPYRFVQLDIETKVQALEINNFRGIFSGYPFELKAKFETNEPQLAKIWNTGWRTARLCAYETYFDCPYYEQLQYIGDTRIQALISLYATGDDRLMRNALEQFQYSQTYEGLTRSSYPNHGQQFIPPFSLFWTLMVNDLRMHKDAEAYCKQFSRSIDGVMEWHKQFITDKGMMKDITNWNFVDWPDAWIWDDEKGFGGIPPGNYSSILNMQYVYALLKISDMYKDWGMTQKALEYNQLANAIKKATYDMCWDAEKGLLADNPEKNSYSQHANLWVVLCDMIPQEKQKEFSLKIINDKSLIPCTIYYKFYLFQAMKKAGLSNLYLENIKEWKDMLSIGLTTFAERPEPSRSDCHAWSASPIYDFIATVMGVEPSSPGFKTVKIAPNLGDLMFVKGKVPHPYGEIIVDVKRNSNNGLKGEITLPRSLTGECHWNGKKIILKEGKQSVVF